MALKDVKVSLRHKDEAKGSTGGIVVSSGCVSDASVAFAKRAAEATKAQEAVRAEYAHNADKAQEAVRAESAQNADEAAHAKVADTLTNTSELNKKFLSKEQNDETPYDLSVGGKFVAKGDVGVWGNVASPDFTSGLAGGAGWQITRKGAAEFDSLMLRNFLEVPELRYNRVEIKPGVEWNSPGGGVIESASPGLMAISQARLKLENGEAMNLERGDLCMGIWHMTGADEKMNATVDADNNGNFSFQGFCTIYFEVETTSIDGNEFWYKMRPGCVVDPQPGMTFVVYGNRYNPNRRKSRYSTKSYVRFLQDVNDWEWSEKNIAAQLGDLSNLTIEGRKMDGYSLYADNVYFKGYIEQIAQKIKEEQGADGAVKRGPNPWRENELYNDGTTEENGVRFLDWVYTENGAGERIVWQCVKTHTSAAIIRPRDASEYWIRVTNLGNLYASTLFAPDAKIDFLTGQEITLTEKTEQGSKRIYGRIGSGETPFFLGADNAQEAIYALQKSGKTRYGTTEGKHIELDPESKNIAVFDEQGALGLEISGDKKSISDIFSGREGYNGTLETAIAINTLNLHGSEDYEEVREDYISDVLNVRKGGFLQITLPYKMRVKGWGFIDREDIENGIVPESACVLSAKIQKRTAGTDWIDSANWGRTCPCRENESVEEDAVILKTTALEDAEYRLCVTYAVGRNSILINDEWEGCDAFLSTERSSYNVTYPNQMASLVANGYFFGTDSENLAALFSNHEDGDRINFLFRNGEHGLKLDAGGVKTLGRGGIWRKLPEPVLRGWFEPHTGTQQSTPMYSLDGSNVYSTYSAGVLTVNFPARWSTMFSSDEWAAGPPYWDVRVTAFGETPCLWSLSSLTRTGCTVKLQKADGTAFTGGVVLEINFVGW